MEHEHAQHTHGPIDWDARYGEQQQMWSGAVNGALAAAIGDEPPGRALDVGCGEGADAIWLAARGWQVTAVDVSSVALGRAREAAHAAGVDVEWVHGDVVADPPEPGTFDLVSMQYPAIRRVEGLDAVAGLLAAVRDGGTLLVVGHAGITGAYAREQGFEPAEFVQVEDVAAALGDSWTIEVHEVRPRVDPPPGAHHVDDVVLRARRTR